MNERAQIAPGVVRGQWHERTANGRLRCELCPRACTLQEGQRGFCFVRQASGDDVVLTTYGRASGFCVDPIEKKPLNHFFPGTSVLSFGTAGCNLGCRFCQNWEISKAKAMDRLTDIALPAAVADSARRLGCKSLAFTYNDPVIFAEYAIDCALAARELGIKTVAVTAGYITERAREAFFAPIDAANVDLKAFTQRFYQKLCFASLEPVLETLVYLKRETQVWLEITTLLIPGQNDSAQEVALLCEWIAEHLGNDVPLHFTAFHPDFKLGDVESTPATTLSRAREQALCAGLQHVYTGNVRDPAGQSTYCPTCKRVAIERDGYRVSSWNLTRGACAYCQTPLSGRFDERPGHWGQRRVRVPMHA
jgi:pyruvate formate lyase activating enzyme